MRRLPGCTARTNLPFVKWWRTKKNKSVLIFLLQIKLKKLLQQRVMKCSWRWKKGLKFRRGKTWFLFLTQRFDKKIMIFIALSSLETERDTVQYSTGNVLYYFCIVSWVLGWNIRILYFHTYERERNYAVNVQCSIQYILLLLHWMLVMSSCA